MSIRAVSEKLTSDYQPIPIPMKNRLVYAATTYKVAALFSALFLSVVAIFYGVHMALNPDLSAFQIISPGQIGFICSVSATGILFGMCSIYNYIKYKQIVTKLYESIRITLPPTMVNEKGIEKPVT